MEVAPELQFKHYTVSEVEIPAVALIELDISRDEVSICCDTDHHVFNPEHTDGRLGAALRASHWFELHEWVLRAERER
jgi:hypothetical protein